ncbi:MAG: succinate dehydrogenase cytochrome b subunit [Desulfobacterales bacterium]|nr:MAG: succinate dehydrogenase cytochrome b subunit [Desulfobacterales bacterium]
MNWLMSTLGSSIGKKLMMALTGLGFIGFLTAHLAGNLTLYGGSEAFNAYAEKLHTLGPLLTLMELGLIAFAITHISTGILLFIQNRNARPVRYARDERAGGRTWSSVTMPYTGFIILVFVVFHLLNFSFVDKTNTTIFEIVSSAFARPLYVAVYVSVMIVVALHARHGFWSALQTLGANHPKYMPTLMVLSLVFSLMVGLGFGLLPIYIALRV